jgi:nicotinamidase-related amidase/type 1 glutamine amidotransferase
VVEQVLNWEGTKTAVVICDMWDRHWCRGATERVAAMAPRLEKFVREARRRGALIIHCPSDTMSAYTDTPQRRLAQSAPPVQTAIPLQDWCSRDPEREPPLPIDDSDGGCDDSPTCQTGHPWTRQIETITIAEGDAVSDSGEVFNLLTQRRIDQVLVLGVHLNMCVLGRPFSIRQLVRQGKRVVLVRDLTDTMYNSRQRPRVNHFTGTDLVVEHVERYWCPTITSNDLLGGQPFRFPEDQRRRILVMIGEDEYQTWNTLPGFVVSDLLPQTYAVTVIHESFTDPGVFPTLERQASEADLLILSVRRRALPHAQMQAVRHHLDAGRPLLAIRTSSHAFAPRGSLADAVNSGVRSDWTDFDPVVLGGNYHNHHGKGPVTTVTLAAGAAGHPIVQDLVVSDWRSQASLYKVSPLGSAATPLLIGSIPNQPAEPVAWTHLYGANQTRVFYTSLGQATDFEQPVFRQLLVQGLGWCLAAE